MRTNWKISFYKRKTGRCKVFARLASKFAKMVEGYNKQCEHEVAVNFKELSCYLVIVPQKNLFMRNLHLAAEMLTKSSEKEAPKN